MVYTETGRAWQGFMETNRNTGNKGPLLVVAEASRMLWAAGVLVAVVAVACSLPVAAAGEPSVYYVNSATLGSFLEKPGMTLDIQDAYTTLSVKNKCTCRVACRTDTRCVAVATMSHGETAQCRLADKGPTSTRVTDQPGATYTFWENSLPAGTYGLRGDRMLYLVVANKANFTAAKELCNNIPGHRLAITKTIEQYKTLLRISNEKNQNLWVDLRREGDIKSDKLWGDNTLYSGSEVSNEAKIFSDGHEPEVQYYRLKNGIFQDITLARGQDSHPLCQADPVGHDAYSQSPIV